MSLEQLTKDKVILLVNFSIFSFLVFWFVFFVSNRLTRTTHSGIKQFFGLLTSVFPIDIRKTDVCEPKNVSIRIYRNL